MLTQQLQPNQNSITSPSWSTAKTVCCITQYRADSSHSLVCVHRSGVQVWLGEHVQSNWSGAWRTCVPDTGSWRQNPPGIHDDTTRYASDFLKSLPLLHDSHRLIVILSATRSHQLLRSLWSHRRIISSSLLWSETARTQAPPRAMTPGRLSCMRSGERAHMTAANAVQWLCHPVQHLHTNGKDIQSLKLSLSVLQVRPARLVMAHAPSLFCLKIFLRSWDGVKSCWVSFHAEGGEWERVWAKHTASAGEGKLLQFQVYTCMQTCTHILCVNTQYTCTNTHMCVVPWYRDSYSQDPAETESEDNESKPTKLVSVVTQVYT